MIGKQIQNYQVTAHLGQGGMGTVYRATDMILGREVALKMLHTPMIAQPQVLERFKKEAQVLARLLHPNIAVIYNLIEQDQQHFMVMEFVEGKDLDGLLKLHRQLPAMPVVTTFIQALEGLHHAHKKGIFHRDIKPANLMLTPDGTVKLMDFGIAKVAGEQRLTQVNRVIGTVEFLAPELIEGKDPSAASDVYAAGMTMYELLCGRLPFENNTDYNLMQEILKKRPLSPDKLNHAVPAQLAAIIMKALEKKPDHRFSDAKSFQVALANAYPAARDADLTHLFSNAVVPLAMYAGRDATGTREVSKRSFSHYFKPSYMLRMLHLPALMNMPALKARLFPRLDKRNLAIAAAMAAIVLATALLLITKDRKPEELLAQTADTSLPSSEAVQPPVLTEQRPTQRMSDTSSSAPVIIESPVVTSPKKETDVAIKKEETKSDKKTPPVTGEKKTIEPPVAVEKPVEKTEIVPEPVKTHPSGSMVLGSKMEIPLYLRDALSENSKTGQTLSFSVTSPVLYQGQVIIEKGSSASGRIKNVGNKKITVVLQSVSCVNGQQLPLQEVELSGRTNEMISNRMYSGYLRKGTIINY